MTNGRRICVAQSINALCRYRMKTIVGRVPHEDRTIFDEGQCTVPLVTPVVNEQRTGRVIHSSLAIDGRREKSFEGVAVSPYDDPTVTRSPPDIGDAAGAGTNPKGFLI